MPRKQTGIPQTCKYCGKTKDSSHFGPQTRKCRACRVDIWEKKLVDQGLDPREERKVRRLKNQCDGPRNRWVVNGVHYVLTHRQYWDSWERQEGKCKICRRPETRTHPGKTSPKLLAADHCHKTGKFRGLLCERCNQSLGKFYDDGDLMLWAAEYLYLGGDVDESRDSEPQEPDSRRERDRRLLELSPDYRRWVHRILTSGEC